MRFTKIRSYLKILRRDVLSFVKHFFLDFGRVNLYPSLDLSKKRKIIYILGNGGSLNKSNLPVKDVLICNHFWRHEHYALIESGHHLISDINFIHARDIHQFIENANPSISIVCSLAVRRELIKLGLTTPILGVNYSGTFPVWRHGVKSTNIFSICFTGSTVIVDIAFPLIKAFGACEVRVLGVDFDYGQNLRSYAFNVENSKLAPDWFMKEFWQYRASKSFDEWVGFLENQGVRITRCIK